MVKIIIILVGGYLYICDWQVFIAEWVNIYYWNLIYYSEKFMCFIKIQVRNLLMSR